MQSFKFSNNNEPPSFTGSGFYNAYKDSLFLMFYSNIQAILSQGHQLHKRVSSLKPGETLAVEGMYVNSSVPLVLRKSGPEIVIQGYEFTMNRLSGLVAAYVFENRARYPEIDAPTANSLGLTWDNENEEAARLYLSAVFGAEHYVDQFSFYPLICALRRMRLNKIKPEMVIKLAKIKNSKGDRMIQLLERNIGATTRLWSKFPGSTPNDVCNILRVINNK